MEAVAVAIGALVLLALWVTTNQRHLDRRRSQVADWGTGDEQLDLWTSAATCVHCGAGGGLLEKEDGRLYFSCLACGRRHERENPG